MRIIYFNGNALTSLKGTLHYSQLFQFLVAFSFIAYLMKENPLTSSSSRSVTTLPGCGQMEKKDTFSITFILLPCKHTQLN